MKKASLLILILIMTNLQAETVFDCYKLFSISDPNFEQGSELFVKVDITSERVDLKFNRGYGASYVPTMGIPTKRFNLHFDSSNFFADWDNGSYLSMVHLGSKWGLYVSLDSEFRTQLGLTEEEEFHCNEKVDITELSFL